MHTDIYQINCKIEISIVKLRLQLQSQPQQNNVFPPIKCCHFTLFAPVECPSSMQNTKQN